MDLTELRRVYARQMLALANALGDSRLEDAFAAVPRESFLGEAPWRILTPWSPYMSLPERDPTLIYQDVVVALDEERGINNGSPALHAHWMHVAAPRPGERVAHIGSGAGYYTAILAELVGDTGHVTAIEFDQGRATSAARHLTDRTNVEVVQGDGCRWPRLGADLTYVNFATSRPAATWIENLNMGGRLILPIGVPDHSGFLGGRHALLGVALMVTRVGSGYAARALGPSSFTWVDGAEVDQSEEEINALRASLKKGGWEKIRSLVWNEPVDDARCWFKGDGWALSYDASAD